MKPFISYIILGVIWITILVRCLPISKIIRKKFKILRHPLYLGLSLLTIGFLFAYQANILIIIIGLVAVVLFYIASRVEDDYNINKFGSSYKEYMQKVPRWNFILGLIRLKNTNL